MKKIKTLILLLSTCLLVACNNALKRAERVIGLIQDEVASTINHLTEIQNLENEIQKDFEDTLNNDSNLAYFNNPDSPIQKNITSRKESLNKLEENYDNFEMSMQEFDILEKKKALPLDEIKNIKSNLTLLNENLKIYLDDYEKNIKLEEQSFQSIANPDSDYTSFFGVFSNVNDLNIENQLNLEKILEYFEPINLKLVDLKVYIANEQGKK